MNDHRTAKVADVNQELADPIRCPHCGQSEDGFHSRGMTIFNTTIWFGPDWSHLDSNTEGSWHNFHSPITPSSNEIIAECERCGRSFEVRAPWSLVNPLPALRAVHDTASAIVEGGCADAAKMRALRDALEVVARLESEQDA